MTSLILAEHDNTELTRGTLSVIAAAQAIGGDIHLLVLGKNINQVIAVAQQVAGVNQVLSVDHDACLHALPENIAPLIVSQAQPYSHILSAASSDGKNIMPRLAALLDVDQISEITAVIDASTFKRPIYAGNGVAVVQSDAAVKVITVRTSAFDPVAAGGGSASHHAITGDIPVSTDSVWVSEERVSHGDRPELTSASIVISGGRGMKNGENFNLLYQLADKLGAAVGASRAAVDAGFVSNEMQVGQTGKVVAPALYIAVGISGAIQHLAGMKESKIIVAINNDPDAPIFSVADYGLVQDLFVAVPEMIAYLATKQ